LQPARISFHRLPFFSTPIPDRSQSLMLTPHRCYHPPALRTSGGNLPSFTPSATEVLIVIILEILLHSPVGFYCLLYRPLQALPIRNYPCAVPASLSVYDIDLIASLHHQSMQSCSSSAVLYDHFPRFSLQLVSLISESHAL
jgi:hypothetical protein